MEELTQAREETVVKQKYLGKKGLVVYLALLSAFVPLSTDLYLPALPTITKFFNIQEYQTNLTLILFFVFYSLATLVWGPLSDKYGRKPIFKIGLTVYMAASVLCALSQSILQLILFRILQAIGGGAASAVATAVVKDVYQGKRREKILAILQTMVVVSPAVAPALGALLLQFVSWRGAFMAQAILGLIVVAGSFAFTETLQSKNEGTVLQTMGRLGVVLKNPAFTVLLVLFSLCNLTFMAFISSSSYIYQDFFGLSSQVYSLYFAFNAAGMLIAPFLYLRLARHFRRFPIICVCFGTLAVSGILITLTGAASPWLFALSLLPGTIAGGCIRPPSANLMLDQQKGDTGAASSLMGSFATVMGSVGMVIASFNPGNLLMTIGLLNITIGIVCLSGWLFVTARPLLSKVRSL